MCYDLLIRRIKRCRYVPLLENQRRSVSQVAN